jgi:hypothetical protein
MLSKLQDKVLSLLHVQCKPVISRQCYPHCRLHLATDSNYPTSAQAGMDCIECTFLKPDLDPIQNHHTSRPPVGI